MTKIEIDELYEVLLNKIRENNSLQDRNYDSMDLELAEKLCLKAFEYAIKSNVHITVSVVDKGGNLILLKRMDKAIIASIDVSYKKAYTALSLNCPSSKVDLIQFPGLDRLMEDKIVLFGGGYPISYKGELIGGIGVSGGNSKQDEDIARNAIDDVLREL